MHNTHFDSNSALSARHSRVNNGKHVQECKSDSMYTHVDVYQDTDNIHDTEWHNRDDNAR
jgi:hypothetical protein